MSERDVRATNGFPNDFWGWGGEDDELYRRLDEAGLNPVTKPEEALSSVPGVITDLEELLIRERGGERAGTGLKDGGRTEWRNMWKRENLARHASTWRRNGVNTVSYGLLATRKLNPSVTVVTVDLEGDKDPQAQRQQASEPIPYDAAGGGGGGGGGGGAAGRGGQGSSASSAATAGGSSRGLHH